MTDIKKKILVLTSCEKRGKDLLKLLSNNNYAVQVQVQFSAKEEELIRRRKVDAVICDQKNKSIGGLSLFQGFSDYFFQIPFFLILDEFDSEEVMLALEAGVSNLFFAPLSNDLLLKKVSVEFSKLEKANVLNTTGFREFFEDSFTPKMLMRNNRFTSSNTMLNELNPVFCKLALGKTLDEIFDLSKSKSNSLNIKRFMNGISNSVKVYGVECKHTGSAYDMLLLRPSNSYSGEYIIELVPLKPVASDDGTVKFDAEMLSSGKSVKLTERETQVLKLSASGMPIKVIAEELKVSNRTIEKHRANIMEKFGANNIIEAIQASLALSGKQRGVNLEYNLN
ncbi:response regulator transcription factor [Litoribacter populi]|uniref:response regulator transcription factor n=1 Tax=Litoribacter populi TaxID=2598460 RepID=UPI0011808853|nr:DNA-binding response regulator [Litoribacter populi]